jgi:hypothetical protein
MTDSLINVRLPDGRSFEVSGRPAWALAHRIDAGRRGCTPVSYPAPRWPAYVQSLRHRFGLGILTRHEFVQREFSSRLGRHTLITTVEIIDAGEPVRAVA